MVTLIIPQVEMGQGVYTSLSMIVAEELDADWNRVRVEHAPANEKLYFNPMLGVQATGNSNSIRAFWKPLRQAGATTRACLVEAAARSWKVPAAECRTQEGKVVHDRTNRTLDYGALVAGAAAITPPKDVPLKDPATFRLIGRPLKRLDTPEKTNGRAKYGIDALPPGVKFATLTKSPVLGGKVARVDDARARAIPGVRQVVVLDDLVAVVGDHMWAAKQGLAALDVTWNDGPNGAVSTDVIWSRLRDREQARRRCRQGSGSRRRHLRQGRCRDGRVRDAAARARDHGALELHRAHHADFGRSVDRDSGDGARASRGREGARTCRKAR